MKTIYLILAFLFLTFMHIGVDLSAQVRTFEKTFGGSNYDFGHAIACTSDGGYVITGLTGSFGDSLGDNFVVKLDSTGTQEWFKITGSNKLEGGNAIIPMSDYGYYVINHTEGYGAGECDGWTYRADNKGNIMWANTYGGIYDDVARDGIQNSEGNLVVAGLSEMFDSLGDAYIANYDKATGNAIWIHTYGGKGREQAQRILQTSDGGYIVAGNSDVDSNGPEDIWVFKTDALGKQLWSKKIGGPGYEEAYGLCIAPDGGYIIAGFSTSYGSNTEDALMLKLDEDGNLLWSKNYGGQLKDRAFGVSNTPDGGFMLTGLTYSFRDTLGDMLLIKTDQYGNQLWMKSYGGADFDEGNWLVSCPGGGYAICGTTKSTGKGKEDAYIVKVNEEGNITTNTTELFNNPFDIKVYPNPAKDNIIFKTNKIDIPKNSSISIFDVSGNKMFEYYTDGVNKDKTIDITKWNTGMYVYILMSNNHQLNEGKFTVIR